MITPLRLQAYSREKWHAFLPEEPELPDAARLRRQICQLERALARLQARQLARKTSAAA